MILPWRDVQIGDGPAIRTSLTANEAATLRELATGKRVLEIGSAYGYSTIVMAQVAESVTAVDPHSGYGSLHDSLNRMRSNLVAYGVEDRVIVLVGSSEVLNMAWCTDASFDLIFIDGDHREEAVRRDVEAAFDLLAEDGYIACHDHGEDTCPDVAKVIDSLPVTGEVVDTLWVYSNRDQMRRQGSLA